MRSSVVNKAVAIVQSLVYFSLPSRQHPELVAVTATHLTPDATTMPRVLYPTILLPNRFLIPNVIQHSNMVFCLRQIFLEKPVGMSVSEGFGLFVLGYSYTGR